VDPRRANMPLRGSRIEHSCPDIGEEEIQALVDCARSLQVKGGERMRSLEDRIADDLDYAGAVATTTGSQAIHLALRALFGRRSALVGLPSYMCRSVYDAVRLAGCRPHLLDIDPYHFSASVEPAIQAHLDAIIVPHMFGIRAPVEAFVAAGLLVIEDCAQRVAPTEVARTEPKPPVRILSFEATKLITCGEGGILLCDDVGVSNQARRLRDAPYDFPEPAIPLPLTDLQASMALVQWQRLPVFLEKRRRLAGFYLKALGRDCGDSIVPAMRALDTYHFRFLLWVDDPVAFMQSGIHRGVTFRRPVAPMPLHNLFETGEAFTTTESAFAHLVSIPLYPRLNKKEATIVADTVRQALIKV
jgi:dTDP-4-amino-4,6-dideoxygalactose transaminase